MLLHLGKNNFAPHYLCRHIEFGRDLPVWYIDYFEHVKQLYTSPRMNHE